jgi:TrmH family RNA methyltransferase
MTIQIHSRSNPRLKELIKNKNRYFFFEGEKLVNDLLKQNDPIRYLIIDETFKNSTTSTISTISTIPSRQGIGETWEVNESVMMKLSSLKTSPKVIAVVPEFERLVNVLESQVIVAVDNLQDPGNAGTILRSAAAFGIDGVVFTGQSVHFNNPKFLRAAQNALFHVRFQREDLDTLIANAQQADLNIYLTSSHSFKDRHEPRQVKPPCLVVLGNEGRGLADELLKRFPTVSIPGTGAVESLNVAVSAGIMMYELKGKKDDKK